MKQTNVLAADFLSHAKAQRTQRKQGLLQEISRGTLSVEFFTLRNR